MQSILAKLEESFGHTSYRINATLLIPDFRQKECGQVAGMTLVSFLIVNVPLFIGNYSVSKPFHSEDV